MPKSETKDFGSGGFAPYGIAGIIKGAAVCFYGFIGKFALIILVEFIKKYTPNNVIGFGHRRYVSEYRTELRIKIIRF